MIAMATILHEWNTLELTNNGLLIRNNGSRKQIVLPSKYHRFVMKELHKEMGHLGTDRVRVVNVITPGYKDKKVSDCV